MRSTSLVRFAGCAESGNVNQYDGERSKRHGHRKESTRFPKHGGNSHTPSTLCHKVSGVKRVYANTKICLTLLLRYAAQLEMPISASNALMPFQMIPTPIQSTMNAESRTTTIMPVCPIHRPTRWA